MTVRMSDADCQAIGNSNWPEDAIARKAADQQLRAAIQELHERAKSVSEGTAAWLDEITDDWELELDK